MSKAKGMDRQFAVLGLGRFGTSLVKTLSRKGYDVLACDHNQHLVQYISSYATHAVQADVTDENDMRQIGIGNFEVVIIGIGSDFEASLMATMITKEMGVPYVMTKARDLRQKKILESVGANRVVLPEMEMGERIANNLITTNVFDFINISDDYGILEIKPRPKWIGRTIRQSNIRAETHLNVVALKREHQFIVSPKPDEHILDGDILVVVGATRDFQRLE